ncbi:hypothetical protein [Bacillus sp. THAF10]|uniref:hypothetical protein n=1 Tax=Bacillus sp. THAF10 TaxID=2587848 RepID=UPI001C12A111|nr:hypothetical protein [Bacillus sp. THAF10]
MMRANHHFTKDDFNRNRLFFGLLEQAGLQIHSFEEWKKHIMKIDTNKGMFVVKGYKEKDDLDTMISVINLLQKSGSVNLSMYHPFYDQQYILQVDHLYWTLSQYLPPKRIFSFVKQEDRVDGLRLLEDFHFQAKNIFSQTNLSIPKEKMMSKWKHRLIQFEDNLPLLEKWFNPTTISEIVYYSHVSLEKLEPVCTKTEDTILHGDVASHNFIRSTDNKVYLIDYDLLSSGCEEWDLVQYASRILPFIKWNSEKFFQTFQRYSEIRNHLWFWKALSFPMDILREGNQFANESQENKMVMPKSFASFTFFLSTWSLRKQFLTNQNNLIQ